MTGREVAWQAAESAASVLGPEADVLASLDSAGLGEATALCFSGSPAATGRISVQFFQSRFSISIETGEPMVLP